MLVIRQTLLGFLAGSLETADARSNLFSGAPEYHRCIAQPSALNRCPLLNTRRDMHTYYYNHSYFSAIYDTVEIS